MPVRPPWRSPPLDGQDVIRLVLDEPTVDLLRLEAEARGLEVEVLIARLLTGAAVRVDELLGSADGPLRHRLEPDLTTRGDS